MTKPAAPPGPAAPALPDALPERGLGEAAALALFTDLVASRSAPLDAPDALAHMDPPVPGIAARLAGLNAARNQNLLHPDLSPFATEAERRAIAWLAPAFGMGAGHLCAGSTIANLAGLWCAREHGARRVVASADAHLSVAKAAHLLAMDLETLPVDGRGRMVVPAGGVAGDAALVATAGTTGRGGIDPLGRAGCLWLHVDAAWGGPLRLTRHAARLDGVELADSVAVSAHKWLYQPKDSALALFRSPEAQGRIAFGGSYLAVPNVGVQGSRGAAAVPLLATLLAWGRAGLAARIEKNVADADALAEWLDADARTVLRQRPDTAVLNWRPADPDADVEAVLARLGRTSSRTVIDGEVWMRQVAANPGADVGAVRAAIKAALRRSRPVLGA